MSQDTATQSPLKESDNTQIRQSDVGFPSKRGSHEIQLELNLASDTSCGEAWHRLIPAVAEYDLTAIAVSPFGVIVAGENGTVRTSTDGRNWCDASLNRFERISDVVWDGARFVAVGFHRYSFITLNSFGVVLSSQDGEDWEAVAISSASLHGIAWNGSVYLAYGSEISGDYGENAYPVMLISQDAVTWERLRQIGGAGFFVDLIWDGDEFVASRVFMGSGVGNPSYSFLRSSDGRHWEATEVDRPLGHFASNGATIVSDSNDFRRAGESDWLRTNHWFSDVYDVAWGNGQFIAVGGQGRVSYSWDGEEWSDISPITSSDLYALDWTGDTWVIVGQGGRIFISEDGLRWNSAESMRNRPTGNWIAAGSDAQGAWLSGSGGQILEQPPASEHWIHSNLPDRESSVAALLRDADSTLALSYRFVDPDFSSALWQRSLGKWEQRANVSGVQLTGAVAGDGQIVLFGASGALFEWDGQTLNRLMPPTEKNLVRGIYWDGYFWLLAASDFAHSELIRWRPEGQADKVFLPEYFEARSMAFNGFTWVVVGENNDGTPRGLIYVSDNVYQWRPAEFHSVLGLNDVTWNGSKFVAVGAFDRSSQRPLGPAEVAAVILESEDGIQWSIPSQMKTTQLVTVGNIDGRTFAAGGGEIIVDQ